MNYEKQVYAKKMKRERLDILGGYIEVNIYEYLENSILLIFRITVWY